MTAAIIFLLTAWLGLNVAFVAMRFYVTSDRRSPGEGDIVGYPKLFNN